MDEITKAQNRFQELIALVSCPPYRFKIGLDEHRLFLQGLYEEADTYSNVMVTQTTRKWMLSIHMTNSEFVQTILKCVLTSVEHRVRESFRYRGRLVYGPHFNVERLWELCEFSDALELRPSKPL